MQMKRIIVWVGFFAWALVAFAYEFAPGVAVTPEERERLTKRTGTAEALPQGLAQEPDPVVRVVYRGHRPFIDINGKLHDPLVNICGTGNPYQDSAIIRCAQVGFGIVQVSMMADNFYRGEGVPCSFSALDDAVRRVLQLNPKAFLMLGIRFRMVEWATQHPDEMVGYGTGPTDKVNGDDYRGRPPRPSPASDVFCALSLRILREYGAYVTAQPWAKRVIGIRLMNGVYAEWHYYGMFEAPDTGLRMQEKFRAHMKAKRGLADAQVPPVEMRRHAGCDLLDPVEDQLVLDYYDFHVNVMADFLLALAAETRRLFPGRLIGAYYGYLFTDDAPEGTNVLIDKVLSSPNIDFLSDPPFYSKYSRLSGGCNAPRTIPSAFRRYGKLSLLEDDSRFHHIYDWLVGKNGGQGYATKTPRETEMNMRRNWLNQFFDGEGIQLNDPMRGGGKRPHAFDDPAVFKAIVESRAAWEKAGEPAVESGNRVAVVMSPRERLRQDGGKGSKFTAFLYQQSFLDLNRSGMAFDMLTFEDYLANPRKYKTILFLNTFYLAAAERKELMRRTREPGMTVIWIGPAGGVTDAGFNDKAMSALTGVTATGVARRPKVVCRDPAAKSVCSGKAWSKTVAEGARSIIVPEPPHSPEEYAALLEEAGAWRYTATGSYFRRHGDIFMFHTGNAGSHTIRLPEKNVKVRELFSDTRFASSELVLETDGPNTWLFKIER